MVLPALIGAGALLGSAALQWWNSEEARKASKEEREEMMRILNGIDEQGNFDVTQIDAPKLAVMQKYMPEVADFVVEQAPQIVEAKTAGVAAGRDAQMRALQQMRGLSESGSDAISRAQTQAALDAAGAQSQGQREAILQQMGARGALTSGAALAAQLQGQQAASQMAQQGSLQSAADSERRRLEAIRSAAGMGSQIRGEDIELEAQNAALMNDFNRRTAARTQDQANLAADTRNRGQMRNIDEQQRVYESNALRQHQNALANQDLRNKMTQQNISNKLNKFGMRSDIGNMARQDIMSGAQMQNQAIGGAGQAVATGARYFAADKPKATDTAATTPSQGVANMKLKDEEEMKRWQA